VPLGSIQTLPVVSAKVTHRYPCGWFNTANIRVFSLAAWNAIAEAKTLGKVRELQGDPNLGTPGVISADTKTNIFFFIAGAR